jgi:hypothetical protein
MVSVKTLIGTVFAGLLLFGFAKPALAEATVSVDRNPVPVNESFELLFSTDYTPDHDPDFSPLQRHFTILGNNRGSSFSLVDGNYRRNIEWTLQLMPKQVGELMIPAIRFDKERSKPFQITVKPSTLSSVPRDELVLELIADVDEVYVQGQVLLTQRLLSATDNSAYEFGDVKIDSLDVVVEPLGDERQYQARIADRRYLVRERQYTLHPQQSGRLEVGPVMAEAAARYDLFGTGGSRRIRSRPLAINVKPIPAGYRAAYWLPATRLELREDWHGDTSALVAGEPVKRSLTLLADGLTAAQLPQLELPAIDGIRQYPQQPGLENSRTRDGIRGIRAQEVALIPGAAGVYRVPELRVPWWNLETGKMEVATLPARELVVAPAAGVALPSTAADSGAENLAPTAAAGTRLWLWSSLLLGCGWAASGFYWWIHARRALPRATAPTENEPLKAARRRLYASCAANDAAAARYALLAWGRELLAPREVTHLHQLDNLFDGTLMREIEALDRSLYAKDHAAWHGGELADLCRRLEREQPDPPREQTGLMPLNPAG